MTINIFKFSDYKQFLAQKLRALGSTERGYKKRTADYIGCQPSYLSQILGGKPHLTLEQAQKLNQYFLHDKIEARFFILLVELGRASTKDLKDFFIEQIHELQQSRFDLKKRLKETDQISANAMNKYYSTWFYSAIHMALAIPELQDFRKIALKLNLPEEIVVSVIRFLEQCGLVEKANGGYAFTKMRIHLDRDSDFIQRHHINWRSQSLQSVEKNLNEDMHFSTVFALSKSDYNDVKEIFVQAIENARKIIRPSKSEEVCAITLDVFKF